jgi:hypothetical protein
MAEWFPFFVALHDWAVMTGIMALLFVVMR